MIEYSLGVFVKIKPVPWTWVGTTDWLQPPKTCQLMPKNARKIGLWGENQYFYQKNEGNDPDYVL